MPFKDFYSINLKINSHRKNSFKSIFPFEHDDVDCTRSALHFTMYSRGSRYKVKCICIYFVYGNHS